MINKLPCYIVKDLLPLYADDLLSPESEQDVRAHLEQCEECGAVYRKMTTPEPEVMEDVHEVDFLKKINKGRKKIMIIAAVIVALVAAGAFINARIQAAKADISYDETTKTMVIYGKDDTDLKLPETVNEARELDAQFDVFHAKVHLPVLRTNGVEMDDYLPAYLGRTNESIKFIRQYLAENCPEIDLAERANKYVELAILPNGEYTWSETDDRIELNIGDFYWHREELYVLSLLGNKAVQWKQLGYAWYLGYCIDPYNEELVGGEMNESIEKAPYYEAYVRGGGGKELNTETFRKLNDAASYVCLTQGMNWGTPYESWALRKTGVYSGPAKVQDPGDDMSVMMATSFIAYLSDKYGFEDVSDFCFGEKKFSDAFGTDWQTAYDEWASWIIETYGE